MAVWTGMRADPWNTSSQDDLPFSDTFGDGFHDFAVEVRGTPVQYRDGLACLERLEVNGAEPEVSMAHGDGNRGHQDHPIRPQDQAEPWEPLLRVAGGTIQMRNPP